MGSITVIRRVLVVLAIAAAMLLPSFCPEV